MEGFMNLMFGYFCWGWVFPYISRIHTAYIGEYLHFRYLKSLVIYRSILCPLSGGNFDLGWDDQTPKNWADFAVQSRADWFVHLENGMNGMKLYKTVPNGPDEDDKYWWWIQSSELVDTCMMNLSFFGKIITLFQSSQAVPQNFCTLFWSFYCSSWMVIGYWKSFLAVILNGEECTVLAGNLPQRWGRFPISPSSGRPSTKKTPRVRFPYRWTVDSQIGTDPSDSRKATCRVLSICPSTFHMHKFSTPDQLHVYRRVLPQKCKA